MTPTPELSVDLLPHRPPFRFVDDVEEGGAAGTAVGHWTVRGDEPWLAGHFPGNPIVPGVLQLEALAQVGAAAVLADPGRAGTLPLFGGVEDVRFRRVVRPGDRLRLEVELEHLGSRGGWGRGRASVDGEETCRARLLFVTVPSRSGRDGAEDPVGPRLRDRR